MAYVKPEEIVENMLQAGAKKASLPVKHLLIRGFLAATQTGWGDRRCSGFSRGLCHDRSGLTNSDSRISGNLAQTKSVKFTAKKEREYEKDEKEPRSGIQDQGGNSCDQG